MKPFIMAELSIPVATIVGAEMVQDASLNQKHSTICETIKSLRDSYMEFCEDEDEFIETIVPIEQDPEPYANGIKKTRPILKKYAQALVDKLQLDQQLEAESEAQRDIHLTPQQVKADVKRYVSICEKKFAKQQEQCDALQKQVEQLMDVVSLIATPTPDNKIGLLERAMIMNLTTIETLLLNIPIKSINHKHIVFATSPSSLEKLLILAEKTKTFININTFINVNVKIVPVGHSYHSSKYTRPFIRFHYEDYTLFEVVSTCLDANVLARLFKPNNQNDRFESIIYHVSPLKMACLKSSLEMVKFLHEKGAKIGDTPYHVPNGPEGDLVAGYLQTHGSKPVIRF